MYPPFFERNEIKLYCCNCLEFMALQPNHSIDLIVTSPPYNMRTRIRNGEYTTREWSDNEFSTKYKFFEDALTIDEYYNFHSKALVEMLRISPLVFWNVQIVTGSKEAIFRIIGDFAKFIKDVIVWDKGNGQPAMHGSVINRGSELILAMESPPTAGRAFSNSRFERGTVSDIWRFKKETGRNGHGASFPESLPSKIIQGWTQPGNLIFDPFCGTGTTLVAARNLNRRGIGCEIQPEYCKMIVDRLSQNTFFELLEAQ